MNRATYLVAPLYFAGIVAASLVAVLALSVAIIIGAARVLIGDAIRRRGPAPDALPDSAAPD